MTLSVKAQDLKVNIYDPPIQYFVNTAWGTDYVVSDSEPFGRPSGVYRNSDSKIYVAIPDTNVSLPRAEEGIVILTSTNNGVNWIQVSGISPAVNVSKTKMIRSGLDSVYCVFQVGSIVSVLNVINGSINTFTNYTNIRDFDVTASSTGNIYLIVDLYTNNDVRIFGSSNGGVSWGGAIFLSSNAARPTITMSGTGDTAVINYYGGPFTDTLSSIIRNVRYRESGPGTLVIAGTFTSPVAAGIPKSQFEAVRYGSTAWLFYTSGTTGSTDINCIVSTDGGGTYGAPFTIGSLPGRDEFWFNANYYTSGNKGAGLIYYSDSAQAGPPTNASDKMYYTSAAVTDPAVFTASTHFSEHPPAYSPERGYIPTLIEYYNTAGDAGALWVGVNGSSRAVYFDRLQSVTGITNQETEIPESFSLGQNYPNPFNPETNIKFSITKYSYVTLKVFDLLGREVITLVNENLNSGVYDYGFNSIDLTSGIYFYKLTAGDYSDVKKMTLLK